MMQGGWSKATKSPGAIWGRQRRAPQGWRPGMDATNPPNNQYDFVRPLPGAHPRRLAAPPPPPPAPIPPRRAFVGGAPKTPPNNQYVFVRPLPGPPPRRMAARASLRLSKFAPGEFVLGPPRTLRARKWVG